MLLCILFCCTSCGVSSAAHYDSVNTDIVAAVDGKFIYIDELQKQIDAYIEDGGESVTEEIADAFLDLLIDERIELHQAENKGFTELSSAEQEQLNRSVSEELSSRYDYFYSMVQEEHPDASVDELSHYAQEAVENYVKKSGDTDDALYSYYRNQIVLSKLFDHVTGNVTVTENEVRAEYDKYVQEDKQTYSAHPEYFESDKTTNAVYYNPAGYRYVKHILLSSAETAETIRALAETEDFEALIEQYSEDTASAAYINGFAVGPDSSLYIDGFADAALALEIPGDISDVIHLEDGYHIIKYMRDIPEGAEPYEDVRDNIESILLESKKTQTYEDQLSFWRDQADIDIFKDVYESLFVNNKNG